MICDRCAATGRKPKPRSTPLAGYCDACGWAIESGTIHPGISPSAAIPVGLAAENQRLPLDWPGPDAADRAIVSVLRTAAPVVAVHDPDLAARLDGYGPWTPEQIASGTALHPCSACGRHPSTHGATGEDRCPMCGLGDEREGA